MAIPNKQWLDALDLLHGAPKITYPDPSLDYPRIERTYHVPLAAVSSQPATLGEFPGSALVQLIVLTRDQLRAHVYVRYETLPGKPTTSTAGDDEFGVEITTWSYTVADGWAPPVLNATTLNLGPSDPTHALTGRRRIPTIPAGITGAGSWETVDAYVIHAEQQSIGETGTKRQIVQTSPVPHERYDFPELTFPFPGIYTSWVNPLNVTAGNGRAPLWFLSSGIIFQASRTKGVRAAKLTRFSTSPSTTMPPEFSVRTAGPESSYIRQIDGNTLHPQIRVTNGINEIEYLPSSSPPPMSTPSAPADQTALLAIDVAAFLPLYYLLRPAQTRWRGSEIWMRDYTIVSEVENMEAAALAGTFSGISPFSQNIDVFLADGFKDWT